MPERYKVSDHIEQRSRAVLEEVLPDVNLPEGVYVASPAEIDKAPSPFVVVTFRSTVKEALKCYERGAMRYVTMNFDKKKLKASLEGKQ